MVSYRTAPSWPCGGGLISSAEASQPYRPAMFSSNSQHSSYIILQSSDEMDLFSSSRRPDYTIFQCRISSHIHFGRSRRPRNEQNFQIFNFNKLTDFRGGRPLHGCSGLTTATAMAVAMAMATAIAIAMAMPMAMALWG